ISSVGHAADGLGRALGRSRVGGSRIKRQPHAVMPAQVAASHANSRVPAVDDTQNAAHTAAVRWRLRRPQSRADDRTRGCAGDCTSDGGGRRGKK
ncbi:hypothetical protein GW17_00024767, partial [Ensete ventricosum]